ncbi:MAG: decaprenyl-phosphate phosphoribosyltransferase [Chloroflexota bacterium]|nr:MAG: decaprenyl-phosphate phosphoribosyltransferase [Chloroflexota bacterium]
MKGEILEQTALPRAAGWTVAASVVLSMRPKQWTKNVVLFAGLVFAGRMFDPQLVARVTLAAVLFSAISGVIYLVNDLKDVNQDRLHPTKRFRPLASGKLTITQAWLAVGALVLVSLPLAWLISAPFGLAATVYMGMMLAYSFRLKNLVVLDVFVIAAGFVLRAVAGGLVAGVPISPWLYVCTSLLALFLGFAKRRQELILLDNDASRHRRILEEYSGPLLDQLIAIVTASAIIAYSLYSFFSETSHKAPYMMLTIPFVVYAIFRYLYLIHARGEGGSPEEVLLKDRPLLGTILLWSVAVVAVLYTSQ